MKTCYYELLEVQSDASDAELKKAYRRKALQLHPDKNPDNVEQAHHLFAQVRAAYEVLSDPQERAWYNSHKSSILNDEDVQYDDVGESHLASIATEEILRYFNAGAFGVVNDDSHMGFYASVSRLFERLAREEVQHGKYQNLAEYMNFKDDADNVQVLDSEYLKFPQFGNSHAPSDQIKRFYSTWTSFATCKSFNWLHQYRYSHASDRKTRRMMERENKKLADDARKSYNETVRSLVSFIKKRDGRYRTAMAQASRDLKKKQARELQEQVRRMHQVRKQEIFQAQSWQKLDDWEKREFEDMMVEEYGEAGIEESTDSEFEESGGDEDAEAEEVHEFECVVCDKVLKNELQFKIHEESKKHKKEVRRMKWEMKREGIDLGIDEEDDGEDEEEFATAESEFDDDDDDESDVSGADLDEEDEKNGDEGDDGDELKSSKVDDESRRENGSPAGEHVKNGKQVETSSPFSNEDESKNKLEQELAQLMGNSKIGDSSDDEWDTSKKKKNKSKKKTNTNSNSNSNTKPKESSPGSNSTPSAASSGKSSNGSSGSETCSVCGLAFDSRNQLFAHVKAENHAAPPPDSQNNKKKKSKRKWP